MTRPALIALGGALAFVLAVLVWNACAAPDQTDADRDGALARLEAERDLALTSADDERALRLAAEAVLADRASRADEARRAFDAMAAAVLDGQARADRDLDAVAATPETLTTGEPNPDRPGAVEAALSGCTAARRSCAVALDTARAALDAERTARVQARTAYDLAALEAASLRGALAYADSALVVSVAATEAARTERDEARGRAARYRRQRNTALLAAGVTGAAAVLLSLTD